MTTFQRLLRGLNVLNRYSGVTDVGFDTFMPTFPQGLTTIDVSLQTRLTIPLPSTLKMDAKDVDALLKADWRYEAPNWIFEP